MEKKFVAYYRVSTAKQSQSGLGIEAQKTTVDSFVNGKGNIIAEFTEIESGRNSERLELHRAMEKAKKFNATLVIAKLDRLSRSAKFIHDLRDTGVDFVACDLPEANTLTIGIMAAMAQHEREIISERTKAALAAKKKQGFKLGSPQNLTDKSRKRSIEVRKAKAGSKWRFSQERTIALEEKRKGKSLRKIAEILNSQGYRTSKNKLFLANTVRRLLV